MPVTPQGWISNCLGTQHAQPSDPFFAEYLIRELTPDSFDLWQRVWASRTERSLPRRLGVHSSFAAAQIEVDAVSGRKVDWTEIALDPLLSMDPADVSVVFDRETRCL